ncbi:MobF family relaxase [Sphingobium sp. B11D3A]|uniref:MobF family relaxase n=1 Tax=Sphingobium sp. B11D3A TaxID=2940574 RepID=UPI0022255F11|nr:MobF family relaxase [Sphingobium sp. B11D3A]MCW2393531.1 conjugative relaxase-like TrwC/TraI family protein [Sphingobium sp. B11D3A]
MLSMGTVRSAGGAATYFASDNYYTAEQSAESSQWAGQGSASLGLDGQVEHKTFEKLLNGELPDGRQVGTPGKHAHGSDFTFSMPKSASLLAYLSGDKRLLDANRKAVLATMKWAEKNLAEARVKIDGKDVAVRTGNLVYALFPHDTSRSLDPQAHIHAVIANMTQIPEKYRAPDKVDPATGEVVRDDGWRAWHNGAMWNANTTLGSIYHATLRKEIEGLGYKTRLEGKHGAFEIEGLNKESLEGFSKRRADIKERAQELGIQSREGMLAVALRTRDPKLDAGDRAELLDKWRTEGAEYAYNGDAVYAQSLRQAEPGRIVRGYQAVTDAIRSAIAMLGEKAARAGDPLIDRDLARATRDPAVASAQHAVASAIRVLTEREAAFKPQDVLKTALDLGFANVTHEEVEARVAALTTKGELIAGSSGRLDEGGDLLTTRTALAQEQAILSGMDEGQGRGRPLMDAAVAADTLQQFAGERSLNHQQLAAAIDLVSSPDRFVLVQGRAGAGKSTMLQPVALAEAMDTAIRAASAQGTQTLLLQSDPKGEAQALAFQNKMVADLRADTGMEASTVHGFLAKTERFLKSDPDPVKLEQARAELAGKYLVLDEASMISTEQMSKLVAVANLMEAGRLAIIGDRKQLSAIEAGKPFAIMQARRIKDEQGINEVNINMRQKTQAMQLVADLADRGNLLGAVSVLGDRVVETKDRVTESANAWLALSRQDRAHTTLLPSSKDARAQINEIIQSGLKDEGTLTGEGRAFVVRERIGLTHEELRYAHFWKQEQASVLEVRAARNPLGLAKGEYRIARIYENGRVGLIDEKGRKHRIDPRAISSTDRHDGLQLAKEKQIRLHDGETIRWTDSDKRDGRGMLNATIAQVTKVDADSVTVRLASGEDRVLMNGDPMLKRIDLAYAINTHMAQGITNHTVFAVMGAAERNLSNARAFLVNMTRQQYDVRLFTDNKSKLIAQLSRNAGDKYSALEVTGKLEVESILKGQGGLETKAIADLAKLDLGGLSDRAAPIGSNGPKQEASAPAPALQRDRSRSLEL